MKKIIIFVFLLNIFYLPYRAYSDIPCTKELMSLSKDKQLQNVLVKLFEEISFNAQHNLDHLWDDVDELVLSGANINMRYTQPISTQLITLSLHQAIVANAGNTSQTISTTPLLSAIWMFFNPKRLQNSIRANYLIHNLLDHPKIILPHIISEPLSKHDDPLLIYAIKNLNNIYRSVKLSSQAVGKAFYIPLWVEIIKKIIEHPGFKRINTRDGSGDTALSYLLKDFEYYKIHWRSVESSMAYKDASMKDIQRYESYGHYIDKMIIEPIIKHPNFSPNLKFKNGYTAIDYATHTKRDYVVKLLRNHPKIVRTKAKRIW